MNCSKCGNPISPNIKFCAKCGTPVPQQSPVQQNVPTAQPVQQNVAMQPQKPPKKKKSSKNLPLIIVAVVLVLAVLASTIAIVPGIIRNKNEINAATEYIDDFPILKQQTELLVFDAEKFPSEKYEIKVERMLMGGVFNGIFRSETIIDEISTEHVYNLDFKEDGDYRITLTDITAERTQATSEQSEITEATSGDKKEVVEIIIIIDVKVEDDNEDAVDKVDINSSILNELPKTPLEALVGTYEGSYFPEQGETGLTLTIYNEGGEYKALFDFYSLPGRTNSKSGKYYMNVTYNEETETYTFTSYEWVEKPSSYIFVDLEGTLNGYVISGESPIKFSVTRINETADENKKEEVDFSQKVSKVNYYNFDGKLVYYEVYAYYDNGLLCSTTLYEQSDYPSSEYTLLYIYDKDGNLKDKCVGGLSISEMFDESTGKVTLDIISEISIYPEKETIEQEKYGVDASKTKKEYGNPVIMSTDNTGDWAENYLNEISKIEPTDITECRFMSINDDIIPEIYIDFGYTASGSRLFTQENNHTSNIFQSSSALYWYNKENKLLFSGGRMGNYFDNIYEIINGEFVLTDNGKWYELHGEDYSELTYEYMWNDKKMSESEYKNHLAESFNENKAEAAFDSRAVYTFDQCRLLLEYISTVG